MANASFDASGRISFRVESAFVYLSSETRQRYTLDEIFNYPGAVRHHIYWHGSRNKADNTLRMGMLFLFIRPHATGHRMNFDFAWFIAVSILLLLQNPRAVGRMILLVSRRGFLSHILKSCF